MFAVPLSNCHHKIMGLPITGTGYPEIEIDVIIMDKFEPEPKFRRG